MVAIVSRELARRAWPGESPLGKRITVMGPPEVQATVVGVAGNVKQLTLSREDEPQLYVAKAQNGGDLPPAWRPAPRAIPTRWRSAVREAIWAVDRDQPVWKIRSMESLLDRDLAPRRFTARLTGGFAVLALLLALIGVYGVMSYVVAQRTREIGIRMALGAARGEVVRLVLGRGLRIVAAGTGLGLVAAYAGARVIESQLFGVPPADLVDVRLGAAGAAVVAAVACWVPARRAARVDPAIALLQSESTAFPNATPSLDPDRPPARGCRSLAGLRDHGPRAAPDRRRGAARSPRNASSASPMVSPTTRSRGRHRAGRRPGGRVLGAGLSLRFALPEPGRLGLPRDPVRLLRARLVRSADGEVRSGSVCAAAGRAPGLAAHQAAGEPRRTLVRRRDRH